MRKCPFCGGAGTAYIHIEKCISSKVKCDLVVSGNRGNCREIVCMICHGKGKIRRIFRFKKDQELVELSEILEKI